MRVDFGVGFPSGHDDLAARTALLPHDFFNHCFAHGGAVFGACFARGQP